MSFRIEEKLLINFNQVFDLKKWLSDKRYYKLYPDRKIKSLYFDNLSFEMYNDSIEGVVPRKKIRIREYPGENDNKYYLEIKHSSVEGRFKTREIIEKKKI